MNSGNIAQEKGKWLSYERETLDPMLTPASQTQETSYIRNGCGERPIKNSLNNGRGNNAASERNNQPTILSSTLQQLLSHLTRRASQSDGATPTVVIFHPNGALCAIRSPHSNRHQERLLSLQYGRTLMACTVRDEDARFFIQMAQNRRVQFEARTGTVTRNGCLPSCMGGRSWHAPLETSMKALDGEQSKKDVYFLMFTSRTANRRDVGMRQARLCPPSRLRALRMLLLAKSARRRWWYDTHRPYALAANRSQVELISILRKLEATPSLEPETILSRSLQRYFAPRTPSSGRINKYSFKSPLTSCADFGFGGTTWEGENALELELARVPARRVYDPTAPRNWRRAEALCVCGSDELQDRWMGGVGKGIDLKEKEVGLNAARRIVLEVRDVVNVADVRENDSGVPEGDLVIDVDKNKAIGAGRCAGPTTARDARSGTWKGDVNDGNINEGRVDDERAALWTYRIFDLHAVSAANNACKDASRFILGLSESMETLRMSVRNVALFGGRDLPQVLQHGACGSEERGSILPSLTCRKPGTPPSTSLAVISHPPRRAHAAENEQRLQEYSRDSVLKLQYLFYLKYERALIVDDVVWDTLSCKGPK
ncbi:hypothetical protein B0H13DRAFT_1852242 [Mycena leptocephala]|nr:hypothetical protein B0H13DRAFT_1852242 [Mycena leptocephala]